MNTRRLLTLSNEVDKVQDPFLCVFIYSVLLRHNKYEVSSGTTIRSSLFSEVWVGRRVFLLKDFPHSGLDSDFSTYS